MSAKSRYHQRRAYGYCGRCWELPVAGRALCERHLHKQRLCRNKPGNLEWQQESRRSRRQAGLCWDCSEPAAPRRTLCERHLQMRRDYMRPRRREQRANTPARKRRRP